MMLLRLDQTPILARCEEQLATVPQADSVDFDERCTQALAVIEALATRGRLVAGATPITLGWGIESRLLLNDREAATSLIYRAMPARGALRPAVVAALPCAAGAATWAFRHWAPLAALLVIMVLVPMGRVVHSFGYQWMRFSVLSMFSSARRQAARATRQLRSTLAAGSLDAGGAAVREYERIGALARREPDDPLLGWIHAQAIEILASGGVAHHDGDLMARAYAAARDLIESDRIAPDGGHALMLVLAECAEGLGLAGTALPLTVQLDLNTLLVRAPYVGSGYPLAYRRIAIAIRARTAALEDRVLTQCKGAARVDEEALVMFAELRERAAHTVGSVRSRAEARRVAALRALVDNWCRRRGDATLEVIVSDLEGAGDEHQSLMECPNIEFIWAADAVLRELSGKDYGVAICRRVRAAR